MASFSIDVAAFARKTNSRLDQATRAIKLSLFSGVIKDTRVLTGRLRGNWQTSTGSPITTETTREDKTGAQAISEAANTVTPFGVDYITNNLPYASKWNQEDGIIAKNIARVERNVREAARD